MKPAINPSVILSLSKDQFSPSEKERQIKRRLEDMEDLLELRAAVERNAGKPGTPWEQVKSELELD
jgi:hypothetical protein